MEFRQLRYALAIAEHRHFGRAAAALGMAQPPLSRQVAALEKELGTRLFERTSRGAEPTAGGAVYLAHARRVLAQLDEGADDARRVARGEAGVLRLGFIGSALVALLPPLLARFRESSPGVSLDCREVSSRAGTAAVLAGTLDATVCRGAPSGPGAERLVAVPVGRDQLIALCHRAHPFAGRDGIAREQLRGQPLVATSAEDEPATATALAGLSADDSVHGVPVTHARDVHTIVGLVACGVGIGLLPSCARSLSRPETHVLEVRPSVRLPDLCLVVRRDDTGPTLAAFLEVTADHCGEVGEHLAHLGSRPTDRYRRGLTDGPVAYEGTT